jgi:transposase
MHNWLGLSDIAPSGPLLETPDLIEIPTTLAFEHAPPCPTCARPMAKNGVEFVTVLDAPSRGKRVRLLLRKERRRCRSCKQQQTASSPDLRPGYHVLTRRLVRYVENRVIKATISDVAQEVGLTTDVVAELARRLDQRLRQAPAHWETPAAIAVDNIQTAPGSRFQVVFDQLARRPMAIAPTWAFQPIREELLRVADVSRVRVFSSDMAKVNFQLADVLTNAIHVADKFHVFHACNAAIGEVINARAATLEERGDHTAARALMAAKPALLGKSPPGARPQQRSLALEPLAHELAQHADVATAHDVRLGVAAFYESSGWIAARAALDDVYRRMEDPLIARAMKPALAYIRNHDRQVLAYFEALDVIGRDLWSPTTNALERYNGTLQEIWRSARGYRDLSLFRLRAIYHPYAFGLHLLDCSRCDGFVGPLSDREVLALSQEARSPALLCRGCAATLDPAESIASSHESGVAT